MTEHGEAVREVERILSSQPDHIVLVASPSFPETWADIYLDGLRVGYVHHSITGTGWELLLHEEWGAPRNVMATYLTRDLAVARIYQELGPAVLP